MKPTVGKVYLNPVDGNLYKILEIYYDIVKISYIHNGYSAEWNLTEIVNDIELNKLSEFEKLIYGI